MVTLSKSLQAKFQIKTCITPVRTFLENNLKHFHFPFGTKSVIAYHDLNYHFSPIFILSGNIIQASNRQMEIFLKYANWLKKNHPKAVTEKILESFF